MEEVNKNYCNIYLVRHGETEWNVLKITQGQTNSELTGNGISQAKEVAEKFKDIKFDVIFSSDLTRAQRTAEIIKLDRDIIIQTSKLLRERSFGRFEGKHSNEFREILKDKIQERQKVTDHEYGSFKLASDVETDEELVTRFIIQLREISVAYPGKTVLVVSHGGCIRNFLTKIGYITRKELPSGSFKNAGYVNFFSDGVDFFVKEVSGIVKPKGGE